MSKQVHIKLKFHMDKKGTYLDLIDGKTVIKKLNEKFLLDSGKSEIFLEAVVSEKIEYKEQGQLGYYFGVIVKHILLALTDRGYKDLDEKIVDEFLRKKFLTVTIPNETTGDIIEYVRSLSSLFKDQMSAYIDQCRSFAQDDLNYYIPKRGEK